MVCQERKQQIDCCFLIVVHILGPNSHCYSPKKEAIHWRLHCRTILAVIKIWSWAQIVECWVLSYECWLLIADCWVLSAECWMLNAECWGLSVDCWVLSAGYYNLQLLEVTKYSYYKWYAENRSHKLTASFSEYRIQNVECSLLSADCWVFLLKV